MPALNEAMTELCRVAVSPQATSDDLNDALKAAHQSLPGATPEQINASLAQADTVLQDGKVHRMVTQQVALLSGSMVEAGGDPLITGWTIMLLLGESLAGANEYCRLVLSHAVQNGRIQPDEHGRVVMTQQLGNEYLPAVMQQDPYLGWLYCNWPSYSMSAVAHASSASELRTKYPENTQALLAASQQLDRWFGGPASFLTRLLQVLNQESLIVLHRETRQGYRCQISGVADNFQLHSLLMLHLIDAQDPTKLNVQHPNPPDILAVSQEYLTGDDRPVITGAFNLLTWKGGWSDGSVPEAMTPSEHWIWNEGVPADIPHFESTRVVLLQKPPYARTWPAGRLFRCLRPEFQILETLPQDDVDGWMRRIAVAPRE